MEVSIQGRDPRGNEVAGEMVMMKPVHVPNGPDMVQLYVGIQGPEGPVKSIMIYVDARELETAAALCR